MRSQVREAAKNVLNTKVIACDFSITNRRLRKHENAYFVTDTMNSLTLCLIDT